MSARQRIVRFIQKPLPDKLAAVSATCRYMVAALPQIARLVGTERQLRRRIFQGAYKNKAWGTDEGFFSGVGSRGEPAKLYVENMAKLLSSHAAKLKRPLTVVDLGCGDFKIGSALVAAIPEIMYLGCDIVPELIVHHRKHYGNERVHFHALDIVTDDLPAGDVCLIRQVLQHLSNADICRVLDRLHYQYVYVTEGQPPKKDGPVNPDKPTNVSIRFNWDTGLGRGVELTEPPFNLKAQEIFRATIPSHEIIITSRVDLHEPPP